MKHFSWVLLVAVMGQACSETSSVFANEKDAGLVDAGVLDAGMVDAGDGGMK